MQVVNRETLLKLGKVYYAQWGGDLDTALSNLRLKLEPSTRPANDWYFIQPVHISVDTCTEYSEVEHRLESGEIVDLVVEPVQSRDGLFDTEARYLVLSASDVTMYHNAVIAAQAEYFI